MVQCKSGDAGVRAKFAVVRRRVRKAHEWAIIVVQSGLAAMIQVGRKCNVEAGIRYERLEETVSGVAAQPVLDTLILLQAWEKPIDCSC